MKNILVIIISFLLVSCQLFPGETELYISPKGNDSNPGTKSQPLKTLAASLDAVRLMRNQNPELKGHKVNIILRKGSYILNETLILEPTDSNIIFKAYKGETAIVTGGRLIKAWKPLNEKLAELSPEMNAKIWMAEVSKNWCFHYMFVNGQRAERSKSDHSFWREWQKDHQVGEPEKTGQLVTFENKEQMAMQKWFVLWLNMVLWAMVLLPM